VQVDPTNLGAGGVFPVAGGPSSLAAGDGALWATSYNGKVTRVASDGGETRPLQVGATQSLADVAAGRGATWVAVSATG